MVLWTKEQWIELFISIHIPADMAAAYADKFILNCITELNFPDFTKDDLDKKWQAEMTRPQFCKFKTDWDVYKYITNLPIS